MPTFKLDSLRSRSLENKHVTGFGKKHLSGADGRIGRVRFAKRTIYPTESTSLNYINNVFGGLIFRRGLSYELRRIKRKFRGKKIRILDWGCGKGNAISELAQRNPDIECLGFSKDSYEEWRKNSIHFFEGRTIPNLKFLHTTAKALEKYLKRHPVHLVCSNLGLFYLSGDNLVSHLCNLGPGIIKGGKIIFDPPNSTNLRNKKYREMLRNAGFELIIRHHRREPRDMSAPRQRISNGHLNNVSKEKVFFKSSFSIKGEVCGLRKVS